jgi:membrane-bound lytic murein transglycosylase D
MKNMEIEVAQLEDMFINSATPDQVQTILSRRQKVDAMKEQYDEFLEELGVYNEGMSETDRIIFRMARLFGECEVALPEGFLPDVYAYIEKWRSKNRLLAALNLARKHEYPKKVSKAMLEHNMPPQFFYLGLQESNLNNKAIGPKTRFGIAKGPWQFIPATAVEFGLSTGPLVNVRQFDPLDDRHNFVKATAAAAKYIQWLYNGKAQASGLLVMASYNWGYGRVRDRIGQMPKNPKERNFWRLYKNFKMPKETKDYVFLIFSAAVIGENPKLFGFDFDNPLLPEAKS